MTAGRANLESRLDRDMERERDLSSRTTTYSRARSDSCTDHETALSCTEDTAAKAGDVARATASFTHGRLTLHAFERDTHNLQSKAKVLMPVALAVPVTLTDMRCQLQATS